MSAVGDNRSALENITRSRIIAAGRAVIASRGIARFTHRAVAAEGKIALASLTYHFESKDDLIDQVSASILENYTADFKALRERLHGGSADCRTFTRLTSSIVAGATAEHREGTMAWLEIMLHGGRSGAAAARAGRWFGALTGIWTDIAKLCVLPLPAYAAQSAIDEANGLMLMAIGLGLKQQEVLRVLRDGEDPLEAWRISQDPPQEAPRSIRSPRLNAKAEQTRRSIIEAAMSCFVEQGLQNVGYRTIAERTGLSESAPYYYFPTIAELLREAQAALFRHSKDRFRSVLAGASPARADDLADLTAMILQNEATRFSLHNLANFSFWLEAGRDPDLAPLVRIAVQDQHEAWLRRLAQAGIRASGLSAMQMQAQFAGLCLRLVSSGSTKADIDAARNQFRTTLARMKRGARPESCCGCFACKTGREPLLFMANGAATDAAIAAPPMPGA